MSSSKSYIRLKEISNDRINKYKEIEYHYSYFIVPILFLLIILLFVFYS